MRDLHPVRGEEAAVSGRVCRECCRAYSRDLPTVRGEEAVSGRGWRVVKCILAGLTDCERGVGSERVVSQEWCSAYSRNSQSVNMDEVVSGSGC